MSAQPSGYVYIPPVFVDPDPDPIPSLEHFRKRPAGSLQIGDFVHLCGEVWRVKDRRTSRTSPRITFTLWNVRGGRPEIESFFLREWIACVLIGDEQPTHPMQPIS